MVDFIINTFYFFIDMFNQVMIFFETTIYIPILGSVNFFEIFTTLLIVVLAIRLAEKLPII